MITCEFESGDRTSLRHAVVDTIVVRGEDVLLVKRASGLLEGGKWGLVGGYVDRDESLKQAVAREVFEETGYRVDDVTLLMINDRPDRPHENRQNIAFVFTCRALERDGVADAESDEQRWFPLSELPPVAELAFDHAQDLEIYKHFVKTGIRPEILELY